MNRVIHLEKQFLFDSALNEAQSILSKSRSSGNHLIEAYCLIRIGTIHSKMHQLQIGHDYYKKALHIATKNKIDSLMGKALLGLGIIHHEKKHIDSAAHYYTRSLELFKRLKDDNNIDGVYNNMALLLMASSTNQPNDSIKQTIKDLLNRSFEGRLARNDVEKIVHSIGNIGLFHYKNGNYTTSIDYYKQSLEISKQKNLSYSLHSALRMIALNHSQLGNNQIAIESFLKYDSLTFKYTQKAYSDKILELETKFRTAEIERDNALKQAQIETQEQRMIYLYIIAAFLGLSILAVYLYNEQRKKVIRALALQREHENSQRIEDLLKQQELKSAYAMLAGQEKAHKRIAMELHDNLGSILVTLNMFADSLQKKTDPVAQKELALKISEVAQVANEATRKISHSLDSGVLKHFGLETAVKELIDALNESETIEVSSHIQVTKKLDSNLSLNVYRIIQELINNTLKHAGASKITIDLNQIKDNLSLIYGDNGVGFELGDEQPKGMGLKNLESRVDSMEGSITIESKKGTGTTTIIEIPIL